ncbi:site-2 protease family protein [Chitinophaga flava]|uniref:Peptidase M50 domain-containing protein n=1 Tax=Chitinophaga flava TaxID=2259036 RepID=A0A365XVB8_9BACT|nr:site-2 protease family protein [Chitinophaga flava]RBL90100.1 hypothetical protein DF182_26900 [Chitinophaga flava]
MSKDLLIFLLLSVLFFIVRFFTILIHELGHAIPAIIFTRQRVIVYIGSYGEDDRNIQFNISLLEINIKRNPLSWRRGICFANHEDMTIRQKTILVLAGPLSSFIIAGVAALIAFTFDMHGSVKLVFSIFLLSAVIDLFTNLYPRTIQLHNHRILHSDGRLLLNLFRSWSYERSIVKGNNLHKKNKLRKV